MTTNKATKKVPKKVTALVDGLNECWPDFDITASDFVNPTLASVIKFYERFVHSFGIKTDSIMKIISENCDGKEHEDIMYVYMLHSCANHIYHLLNLTSSITLLSLSSFINPVDDQNLVTRITLLANYLYYAEARTQDTILPLKNKVLEEVDAHHSMKQKVNMLNEHLKTASNTRARDIDKLQNLKKNNNVLKADIKERQNKSEDLEQKISKLNAELKVEQDEKDKLTESVDKNWIKGKELKSLMVEDHETIQSQYEQIEREITEAQSESSAYVINLESRTQNESTLMKNYTVVCALDKISYLPKILETYNIIEAFRLKKEYQQKEFIVIQKIENDELKLRNELESELTKTEQNYINLSLESSVRCKSLDDEITRLNLEYETVKKDYEKRKVQVEELNEKLKHFDVCCSEYKKSIDKQQQYYDKLYESFINAKNKVDVTVTSVLTKIQKSVTNKT